LFDPLHCLCTRNLHINVGVPPAYLFRLLHLVCLVKSKLREHQAYRIRPIHRFELFSLAHAFDYEIYLGSRLLKTLDDIVIVLFGFIVLLLDLLPYRAEFVVHLSAKKIGCSNRVCQNGEPRIENLFQVTYVCATQSTSPLEKGKLILESTALNVQMDQLD